jgi:NAD(P)-dependent dehydrogenase (short-subunit alcohol dehydrogenase family)
MRNRKWRSLQGQVVVITGASSGIGRAAALQFAAAGARVVLAARRAPALEEVALACRRQGASAHVAITDVTREADLQQLVERTLARWGRIDVWINNAGTTLFARLEEGAFLDHRQVLETNLIGPMFAARLVLPIFRRQGAGTLINIGSVLSQVGQPYVPSYVISKFGLQGLSEAIRAECADIPSINICTVMPYATDTPHFEEGGNAIGKRAYGMPPIQDPERVAAAILDVAAQPRRLRYVPRYAALGIALHWLWPRATERLLKHALTAFHLVGSQPPTRGNLFGPTDAPGSVHGARRPVVSAPAFIGWVMLDLLRMGWEELSRRHPSGPLSPSTREARGVSSMSHRT